jgi:hypothetical protein
MEAFSFSLKEEDLEEDEEECATLQNDEQAALLMVREQLDPSLETEKPSSTPSGRSLASTTSRKLRFLLVPVLVAAALLVLRFYINGSKQQQHARGDEEDIRSPAPAVSQHQSPLIDDTSQATPSEAAANLTTPPPPVVVTDEANTTTPANDDDAISKQTPIAYSYARTDRAGSVIQELLYDHAFCFSKGWEFGGTCVDGIDDKHSVEHQRAVEHLLRGVGLDHELVFACPPGGTANALMLDRDELKYAFAELDLDVWKSELLEKMKERTNDDPKSPWRPVDESIFHVAVHIRRGDIAPCSSSAKGRYLSNIYYLLNIESVLSLAGSRNVEVTVYSESPRAGSEYTQYEDFEEFRDLGYNVELDGDIVDAWDGMIRSDVLIVSQSSFSMVPAFLKFDQGLVIHGKLLHQLPPQKNWKHTDKAIRQKETETKEAIQKEHCPS